MVLALDEPNDDDSVFEVNSFSFCVNKELLESIEGVSLDFGYTGFAVTPTKPLASAGGSCGGCASSGSCGS